MESLTRPRRARTHTLAAPLRTPRNTGQRLLLLGLDQRLPSGGRGDGMAGADQSAKDSEPETSQEKKNYQV